MVGMTNILNLGVVALMEKHAQLEAQLAAALAQAATTQVRSGHQAFFANLGAKNHLH